MSKVSLIIDGAVAFGTVAVAIVAIWQDYFRQKVAAPKLRLGLGVPSEIPMRDGSRRIFHHITVRNTRHWAPARRVRILCGEIEKRGSNGTFKKTLLAYPVQLTWSPTEFHELFPTISKEDVCDLGCLTQSTNDFRLWVYAHSPDFPCIIGPNETMRVFLIASADNFVQEKPYIVEICWDGAWTTDLSEMANHLRIREVTN
jgi:hypothetical protein